MAIDYQERIPNNVDLAENRTLQRALEHWQPRFLDWWRGMGPSDFLAADVYLRTPTSVEQQRLLGHSCPSLYDLRNLFQINVEEGRHLWAMVYLLHAYFGRDGREEAEAMLERHSGDPDKPRILGAFNEATPDWLSFFMFTYFTDRDGKYQLASLAESGFDPLARSCRF